MKWKGLMVVILVFLQSVPLSVSFAQQVSIELNGRARFDRDLKAKKSGGLNLTKMEIDRFKSIEIGTKLNYRLLETTTVYGLLGYTQAKIKQVKKGDAYEVETQGPVIGMGGEISKFYGKWLLGMEANYRYHKIGDYMHEFEISPKIGRKIGRFLPYIDLLYSDFRIKDGEVKLKAEEKIGLRLGCEYRVKDLSLTIGGVAFPETKNKHLGNKNGFDSAGFKIGIRWIF